MYIDITQGSVRRKRYLATLRSNAPHKIGAQTSRHNNSFGRGGGDGSGFRILSSDDAKDAPHHSSSSSSSSSCLELSAA